MHVGRFRNVNAPGPKIVTRGADLGPVPWRIVLFSDHLEGLCRDVRALSVGLVSTQWLSRPTCEHKFASSGLSCTLMRTAQLFAGDPLFGRGCLFDASPRLCRSDTSKEPHTF